MSFKVEVVLCSTTQEIQQFMVSEWPSSNLENFGRDISDAEWNDPFIVLLYLVANDDVNELAGIARCKVVGSTVRLSQLLVKTKYRRKMGIGTQILQEIESLCVKNNWHKIRLSTSKKHHNLDFYLKNGFKIEATLDNDAFGFEWYILSKFIEV
ncbi:MAG: GNAT family N-acetyltransferase [Candidatus Hodarchaeales archaeon]